MTADHRQVDYRAQIEQLSGQIRERAEVAAEQALIDLRIRACKQPGWRGEARWSGDHDARFAGSRGLPEIAAEALDAATLKAGVLGSGGLIVRSLMPPGEVAATRERIQRTLRARRLLQDEACPQEERHWYRRSPEVQGRPAEFRTLGSTRYSDSGTVWAADSPRTAFHLLEFYHRIGLPGLLRDYFNEPAVLSVRKWVLRCLDPVNLGEAGWHQDGRFLGAGIQTVNLWVALTDCGGDADAPGMDIVPSSERIIHETGTRGAVFDWTVGQGIVDEVGAVTPPVCPRFAPGDAIFFDHYNLHRSASSDLHRVPRYAVESWFFAASTAPEKQMPILL
jgi:Phytanoyl-CoA dioxygenase (PhyH)